MPDIAIATITTTRSGSLPAQKLSLRQILKEATAANHARLDAQLGAFDLHSLPDYRSFLQATAAALLPLEDALLAADVRSMLPDWNRHSRSRAILTALAAIGGIARRLDPPPLADRFAVLGTLYVLEGSRLGAAYLLRHVRRANDPRILNATAYLAHGAGQNLWQHFLAVLEQHAEPRDETDIIDPARRAFDLFAQAVQS